MDCLEPKIIPITLNSTISIFSNVLMTTKITTELHDNVSVESGLQAMIQLLVRCRHQNAVVYIAGNGGSAAIASHAVIDFMNMAKMKAMAMLDPAVTTCISNDYGYEHIYAKQLTRFISKDDVLIAISSSGRSENIVNAVDVAKKQGAKVITLSGFAENNPLRQIGNYNLWLNSHDYGHVEIGHAFVLHYITDRLRDCLEQSVVGENKLTTACESI